MTKKSVAGGALYFGKGKKDATCCCCYFFSLFQVSPSRTTPLPPAPQSNEGARTIMINVFNLDLLQLNVFIQGIYKLRILCIIFVWLYIIKDKYFLFRGVYYCSNVNIKLFIRELFYTIPCAYIWTSSTANIYVCKYWQHWFFYLARSLYLDWTQRFFKFTRCHGVLIFDNSWRIYEWKWNCRMRKYIAHREFGVE